MANVFDVARYILTKKGPMSTWRMQSLCFYVQAWHYTWTEKPLFDNKIEAWANGPICRDLYNYHRGYFIISESGIPCGRIDNLSEDEKESIDIVLRDYGELEPYNLKGQVLSEQPWAIVRNKLIDGSQGLNEISLESMKAYYGSL